MKKGAAKQSQKNKKTKLLRYLAIGALVTSLAASGTLAKYSSTFTLMGYMQIAGFAGGGSLSFEESVEDVSPVQSKTVEFQVCNFTEEEDCDVQMQYEVQVETMGNLPLEFDLVGKREESDTCENSKLITEKLTLDSDDSSGTKIWKAGGGLLPVVFNEGRKTHTYQLTVKWQEGKTDGDYSHEIDMLSVTVNTVQVDPGAS